MIVVGADTAEIVLWAILAPLCFIGGAGLGIWVNRGLLNPRNRRGRGR